MGGIMHDDDIRIRYSPMFYPRLSSRRVAAEVGNLGPLPHRYSKNDVGGGGPAVIFALKIHP